MLMILGDQDQDHSQDEDQDEVEGLTLATAIKADKLPGPLE